VEAARVDFVKIAKFADRHPARFAGQKWPKHRVPPCVRIFCGGIGLHRIAA
jgi:hypothetical protein